MDSGRFISEFSLTPINAIDVLNFYVWRGRLMSDAVSTSNKDGDLRECLAEREALHSFGFGRLDGKVCVLHVLGKDPVPDNHTRFTDFRTLMGTLSGSGEVAANHALQLGNWLSDNRYCSSCGTQLQMASNELRMDCPNCLRKTYPVCTPVCIGVVTRGQKILLARSPHFPQGVYSALAGYLHPGESAEDCIRREIHEETGILVAAPQWYASQAWPYPHSLMLGFLAEYSGGEIDIDRTEIEDAAWFQAEQLPLLPHASTLSYRLIQAALTAN